MQWIRSIKFNDLKIRLLQQLLENKIAYRNITGSQDLFLKRTSTQIWKSVKFQKVYFLIDLIGLFILK